MKVFNSNQFNYKNVKYAYPITYYYKPLANNKFNYYMNL